MKTYRCNENYTYRFMKNKTKINLGNLLKVNNKFVKSLLSARINY